MEEADGVRFLSLELVEGETLAERFTKGPLLLKKAVEVCPQIAKGVETSSDPTINSLVGYIPGDKAVKHAVLTPHQA